MDLFKDLIPGLIQKKNYILTEENESEYKSYVVNMALANNTDLLMYVNEMNQYPLLDKKMQYDFYYHILKAKKRPYSKWFKPSTSKDLFNVKEYFGFSSEKAKEALSILTKDQLEHIANVLNKDGVVK